MPILAVCCPARHTRHACDLGSAKPETSGPTPGGTPLSRIKHLNWNLLRTFLTIVEERSLTRAADRLLLRQPSVTAALQKLEETLGCQLIQRDSRRFVLTAAGEILRQECADIHARVERIGERLALEADDLTGLIRIATVTHLAVPQLDRALRLMHRRHPSVTVRITVASSQDIVRALTQNQAAFGFCLLPKPLAGLDCRFLLRERFGIFCGALYPLAGRGDVTLAELRREPFVTFACGEDGGALEPMVSLRDGAGLGSRSVASSANLEEVRRMIAAGLGIGILPVDAARAGAPDDLWQIPLPGADLGADAWLITNPEIAPSPAERAFRDILESELDKASEGDDPAADPPDDPETGGQGAPPPAPFP